MILLSHAYSILETENISLNGFLSSLVSYIMSAIVTSEHAAKSILLSERIYRTYMFPCWYACLPSDSASYSYAMSFSRERTILSGCFFFFIGIDWLTAFMHLASPVLFYLCSLIVITSLNFYQKINTRYYV